MTTEPDSAGSAFTASQEEYPLVPPAGYVPPRSPSELLERYNQGERYFAGAQIEDDRKVVKGTFEETYWQPDLRGIKLSGVNLYRAGIGGANFEGADLRDTHLGGAYLEHTNLRGAKLVGAFLGGAQINQAYLENADLTDADLTYAGLEMSELSGAVLRNARLQSANLQYANLSRADVTGAYFGSTILADSDLREVIGLEAVKHNAASIVDKSVLQQSKGQLPIQFLRGCGLSDWEIALADLYNPDLTSHEVSEILYDVHRLRSTSPIQINPIFISYSHADEDFVERLEENFDQFGIRYWRDVHDFVAGRIESQISSMLALRPTVLVILSRNSVNSDWVAWEVGEARKLERQTGRDVLCPISIDDAWKTCNWPARMRVQIFEYNVVDFKQWETSEVFE